MNDIMSLSHSKYRCKYHVVLHQNIEGKKYMKK